MESLAKVREGYARWAMVYDDDQNPLQWKVLWCMR